MPVTPEMNKLLAQIGALSNAPRVNNGQLARQVLLGAGLEYPKGKLPQGQAGDSGGPSVVSRIFDILSRPNYAVANYFDTVVKYAKQGGPLEPFKHGPEALGALVEGLEGQAKTTFSDVLGREGMPEGAPRAILGLIADIGADPTTYIGAGAVKGIGKALGIGGKAVTEAKGAATAVEDIAKTVDNAAPELVPATREPGAIASKAGIQPTDVKVAGNKTFPPVGSAAGARVSAVPSNIKFGEQAKQDLLDIAGKVPKHARPEPLPQAAAKDYKAEFRAFMESAKTRKAAKEGVPQGPRPKRSDFKSAQAYGKAVSDWKATATPPPVEKAHDIVAKIAAGDIPSTVKATPKPRSTAPATGMQTAAATSVAKNYLSKAKLSGRYLNPTQQLRVFKNLLARTVGQPVDRISQAVTMLREAEKYFKSQGLQLTHWDGMRLPLSELIDELGGPARASADALQSWSKSGGMSDEIAHAVENIRARSAMEDVPWIKLGLDQTVKQATVAEQVMSPAKYANFVDSLKGEMSDGLRSAGVSPGAVEQSGNILDSVIKADQGPMQTALNGHKGAIHAAVAGDRKAWKTVNGSVTHKMENAVGVTERQAGQEMGKANKAWEFLGLRFATHYGMKDLRPTQLDFMLSAEANAERRHRLWRDLVRSSSADQRAAAFRIAQGKVPAEGFDQATVDIANRFKDSMERLFSSSGVRDEADSMALRAGFVREDLNKELRILGSEGYFDAANGTDWLKTWENWDVTGDPMNQIAKLETAAERLSKKYGLFDEISERWGAKAPTGDYRYKVSNPRFDGYYFPKEMVPQIQRMLSSMENMYDPKSPMMKYLDEALSIWKTAVTIYSPAHHIRNAIGDAWLSWIAGVNNPGVYRTAAKVMKAQKGRYRDLPDVEMLVGKTPQARTAQRPLVTLKNGQKLTADQIYNAAHQHGLLLSARQIEDIFGEPVLRGRIQPFGGRVHDATSSISENREHFFRLAHFVDAIKKSKAGDLKSVFADAAHQVRKWHPDGMDMTNFERKYLKRIFPFYSWSRKALPLVLESIVMKPGKVLAYPKGMQALQEAMGIESPDRGDPFPTDQLFPDWIREKGIGPIGLSGSGGVSGFIGDTARQGVDSRTGLPIGGYAVLNPSNPMIDTISQLFGMGDAQSGLSAIGESLNPGLRIPAELLTGSNAQTGAPIRDTGQQFADYATNQIPGVSILSRLTNLGVGGPTARGEREGLGNLEALVNQLTAAGLLGTGPYVKQAQFEQRDRMRNGSR